MASCIEANFTRRRRISHCKAIFHSPARVDLVENDRFQSESVVFWWRRGESKCRLRHFVRRMSPLARPLRGNRSGITRGSTPHLSKTQKVTPCGMTFCILVEARGVEPLSESTLKETSPGAVGCFWRSYRPFPSLQAKRQACSSGSFIMRGGLKALHTHGRLSSTPHFRVEAVPEGTGHGLSRGQSNFVVVL